jgi:hypothetical protein
MDGHHSHKTLDAVNKARENGVIMITLPPHCTHRMQPLDRTFFKGLKSNYNISCDSWMKCNARKRISFFEMSELFGQAYAKSANIEKAIQGFACTGLWPFKRDIFSDDDFDAAELTEEPLPSSTGHIAQSNTDVMVSDPVTNIATTSSSMDLVASLLQPNATETATPAIEDLVMPVLPNVMSTVLCSEDLVTSVPQSLGVNATPNAFVPVTADVEMPGTSSAAMSVSTTCPHPGLPEAIEVIEMLYVVQVCQAVQFMNYCYLLYCIASESKVS